MAKRVTSGTKIKQMLHTRKVDPLSNRQYLEKLSYKTPFFLFDKQKIIKNFLEYKQEFPHSSVHYAMKANSEPMILKLLNEIGAGFEVASVYELEMLKKFKVAPEKIIFGSSVKPEEHIRAFYKYGVDRFAFDSLSELEKIAAAAPHSRVYVRTIANDSGSVFKFSEKFGTDPASIIPLLTRAKELGLKPYGISFHVGSQASDAHAWANALVSLRSIIQDLKELGITLQALNLGGGYPCKYASNETAPTIKEIAEYTHHELEKLPYKLHLILEPGRGIVADAGILVTKIIGRVERRGNTWLFLDSGVYNALFEAMSYQGSTRYGVMSIRGTGDSGEALFELAGPTGDSPDVITREALLPQDIAVGERLVFQKVGAYSLSVTSSFNGFPKPDCYFV